LLNESESKIYLIGVFTKEKSYIYYI